MTKMCCCSSRTTTCTRAAFCAPLTLSCARSRRTWSWGTDGKGGVPVGRGRREQSRRMTMRGAAPCRVLVLGGSGRVGYETALALTKLPDVPPLAVTLAGRNMLRAQRAATRLARTVVGANGGMGKIARVGALSVDLGDMDGVEEAVRMHDVVVHAAGPFQQRGREDATRVLRAAARARVRYVDVCDDASHAAACAALRDEVAACGVPAIVSAGIYPGVANLLALRAIDVARGSSNKHGAKGKGEQVTTEEKEEEIRALRLFYHTAGSGGIGATVLASTFLLLSERALLYEAGGARSDSGARAGSLLEAVDFGGEVGRRTTFALSLPEVESLHAFAAPRAAVSAKFSTAPPLWNWLLVAMARLTSPSLLAERSAMLALARVSMPVVRAVDRLVGARTVILARAQTDVCSADVVFDHPSLAASVGLATAAFVRPLVDHALHTQGSPGALLRPGVWYPEQLDPRVRDDILRDATATCDRLNTHVSRNDG